MPSEERFESMLKTLSSNSVSNETKQQVLKRAVSQCPSITMELFDLKVLSLLDLGSMVTLIHENYFNKHILPLLCGTEEELTEAHSLLWLSTGNNQVMPVSKYFKADISLLGFNIPSVGFLVVKDPNTILEPQHSIQLLGLIGYNLIWLGCEEFGKVYGFEAFKNFSCPDKVHPLVFAQMCTLYHQYKFRLCLHPLHLIGYNLIQSLNLLLLLTLLQMSLLQKLTWKIKKDLSPGSKTVLGQVWVSSPHEAICILANSVKVVKGKTSKIAQWLLCMIEAMSQNNLLMGIVVNWTMVTPIKSKSVPVTVQY